MKKVIALRGVAKVGKSQTIRKAYDLLLVQYPSAQRGCLIIGKTDVRVILTIDGVRIGIESQGDPNGRLKASLDLFVQEGCQVIVCATRTSGMTVEAVNRLEGSYNLFWFDQVVEPQPSEQASRNHQMATRIVEEVKQAIAHDNALQRTLPRR